MTFDFWDIPSHLLAETAQAFTVGHHEIFVLWTAPLYNEGPVCVIRRCIVPRQEAGFSAGGAYVHIDGRELSRIQFENYDRVERSVVQLHTHPSTNVNMSLLDREWEVVKHVGALSIIVPSYGRAGLKGFLGVQVYEREPADWRLWTRDQVEKRLRVVDE